MQKPNDSVVSLLSEMNKEKFDHEFLAPRISVLVRDLEEIDVKENPSEAFKLFFLDRTYPPNAGASKNEGPLTSALNFFSESRCYRTSFVRYLVAWIRGNIRGAVQNSQRCFRVPARCPRS